MADYLYSSARIKALETHLIGREGISRLVDANGVAGAYAVLAELGADIHRDPETGKPDREGTLLARLGQAYAEIAENAPDAEALNLWRYPYDCNNVKAAIKCFARRLDCTGMLFDFGTVPAADVKKMAETGNFEGLPTHMSEAAGEAVSAYAKTQNPRLIDLILDRACYRDMLEAAEKGGNEYTVGLVRKKIDLTNLLITVRILRMKMGYAGEALLSDALLPGGTLPDDYFTGLFGLGEAQLWEKLLLTDYSSVAKKYAESDGSLTAAECLADNCFMEAVRTAGMIPSGEEVLVAYLVAAEYEARNIRIVLAGKEAGLDADTIRERIRESYV